MYTFVLRLIPGLEEVLEWDVQLHGIPITDGIGKEVVANWEFPGFQGGSKTFFTDSNGLEMQKRVLDTREDFTLKTDQYASSNYYPVQSALAMRSLEYMQVTMMNDRSQGASVLADGSIEFMINRRLLFADSGAQDEPLNEVDANGFPVQVNTRFHMQYFETIDRKSLQRQVQRMVDEPIQLFVATGSDALTESIATSTQAIPSFDGELKIHLLPQGKNDILIRVENLYDLFDVNDRTDEHTFTFDFHTYALNLFAANNAGDQNVDIKVTERSLSNN